MGQFYVAVYTVHGNTGRPHVHVLIAGAGHVPGTDRYKTVRIKEADHAALKSDALSVAARFAEARSAERAAALRRELDALVYWPSVPTPPTPISIVRDKEEPRESLISRLFRRSR